ncbi:MAG: hypothetical protein ACI83P_001031 [Janthinobacterium sp.]|jgi:hypothetical protein
MLMSDRRKKGDEKKRDEKSVMESRAMQGGRCAGIGIGILNAGRSDDHGSGITTIIEPLSDSQEKNGATASLLSYVSLV